jgi:hypothetical protein
VVRGLGLGASKHLAGVLLSVGTRTGGVLARMCSHLLGGGKRVGAKSLALGNGVLACELRLLVQPADRSNGLVASRFRLRASGGEQIVGLLVGGSHAMLGGAVRLGNALSRTRLGVVSELGGGALGGGHDRGDSLSCPGQWVAGCGRG